MNDLDKTLKTQTLIPKRTLRIDFTQGVLKSIQEKKDARWPTRLFQKLRTKLGFTILTGILLIGGTAAASSLLSGNDVPITRPTGVVIKRPIPQVTQILTQPLPNGNHLVGFATQNCQSDPMNTGNLNAAPNQTMLTQQKENMYYDVPKTSPLTNDQLRSTLLAQCEENISFKVMSDLNKSLPVDKQGAVSEAYVVTAISAHSLTVSPDPNYKEDPAYTPMPMPQSLTFTRFDSDLTVYNQTTKSSFKALHVGDDIKMINKQNYPQLTKEQIKQLPPNYQGWEDGKNYVVEVILKTPPLTGNPELFFTGFGPWNVVNGLHVYRDIPCTTDPTGFCRAVFGTP